MAIITTNKKTLCDYNILETFEAGLVLSGPEVKSIKLGNVNLQGSYIAINARSEPELINCYIAPYALAKNAQKKYNPLGARKLLLTKKEIRILNAKNRQPGLTILVLSVYTKHKLIKAEIGLAQGKKKYDKRETIKKRDINRQIRRELRHRY